MFQFNAQKQKSSEKRNLKRKAFSYYMQVVDDNEERALGYLTDISQTGFRLDSKYELPINRTYSLRMDLPEDLDAKSSLTLVARNRWCRHDELDPFLYNVGFQIVSIAPEDAALYERIVHKYAG